MTGPAEPHIRFSCAVTRGRDHIRVALAGELDMATVDEVRGPLTAALSDGTTRVVLDLSELVFIDSSGLRMILDAFGQSRNGGAALALVPGPPAVQRIFHIAGVHDVLDFGGEVE
jgi:anti-anti-sigma factor